MRKDTRNHPYEVYFSKLRKSAAEFMKTVPDRPRSTIIEPHIRVKWSDEENGWGMYNYRLEHWVREEYADFYPVFKTENQALSWYKGLI